ncbi:MAG: thioredoxin family protein [Pseudomonadota bacterium]
MLLDTPVCDFGARAPAFVLRDPGAAEAGVPMSAGDKGLLVAFICNHCPYVLGIAERLASDLNSLLDEGFGVLAVMSNDYAAYPADAPDRMAAFAKAHGFRFPYLVDEDQAVARAYGAVCTPDFFGYNAALELQYRGRLDDAGRGAAATRVPELLNAMRQIGATGQGPRDQVASMGCSIKWR